MSYRIAFVSFVLLAGVASAEEPFADLSLKQAKEQAREKNRVVMIDFYTTWCGPCKQLDKTTWKDDKVREWLSGHVIALKLDAEKHAKSASTYKVNAYPTILFIKPDGKEIDRIVGYKPPAEFLSEARDLLAGKDSVARAREKVTGDAANDPMARMRVADALRNKGNDKEALDEYLWCFDHGLEHSQSFYGVRLSFLLSDIVQLGQSYPPALDALRDRRDKARKAIMSGKGTFNTAHDFQSLCQSLGDQDAALALYDELAGSSVQGASDIRRQMGSLVFEPLVKARRYKDAFEAGGGTAPVDNAFTAYEHTKSSPLLKEHRKELAEYHKGAILETGGKVYETLLGANKPRSARKLAARLVRFDGSNATYELLIKHANRARASAAVIELRKTQEEAGKKRDAARNTAENDDD